MNMLRNVVAHEIGHVVGYRYAYNNNYLAGLVRRRARDLHRGQGARARPTATASRAATATRTRPARTSSTASGSKWKAQVKALVKAKQDKSIDAHPEDAAERDDDERAGKAMAVVDFWMKTEPAKLTQWLALTKKYWPQQVQYRMGGRRRARRRSAR